MRARSTSLPRGARHRRRRARVRPPPDEYRCAPLVELQPARLGAHDRAPLALRGGGRDPDRRAEGGRRRPSSPASPRRSTARRPTTACTPRCGRAGCATSRASAKRSTSCGRTRSACSSATSGPSSPPRRARPRRRERARRAHADARGAVGRDDRGAALGAGCAVVTPSRGLGRARGDPRPGDPGDLARRPRRHPRRAGRRRPRADRVHADLPRLPRARGDAACDGGEGRRARRRAGGRGDPGRLVVDRPDHARRPREAARGGLRAAGAARAAGRPTLVQLQSKAFRCPYCGSTETRLENIFGPTPCRSLRYCESCRQPFEQFKTI